MVSLMSTVLSTGISAWASEQESLKVISQLER